MTVYFSTSGGPTGNHALTVGANDIRIIGVELMHNTGGPISDWFYLGQAGSSASGGTVEAPYPAHFGAPASTVTARIDDATVSGTFRFVGSYVLPNSTVGLGTTDPYSVFTTTTWKPQGDLIIPTGGVFYRRGQPYITVIWFEELRLSYGY